MKSQISFLHQLLFFKYHSKPLASEVPPWKRKLAHGGRWDQWQASSVRALCLPPWKKICRPSISKISQSIRMRVVFESTSGGAAPWWGLWGMVTLLLGTVSLPDKYCPDIQHRSPQYQWVNGIILWFQENFMIFEDVKFHWPLPGYYPRDPVILIWEQVSDKLLSLMITLTASRSMPLDILPIPASHVVSPIFPGCEKQLLSLLPPTKRQQSGVDWKTATF